MTETRDKGSASKLNLSSTEPNLESQLSNAVVMAAKEDQIAWTIFSVFWAANTVLLAALFASGELPPRAVGLVVSATGFVISWIWLLIQRRAIGWLEYYERIIRQLEEKYLKIPHDVAMSGHLNQTTFKETVGRGVRVRPLMAWSGAATALFWMAAIFWFIY